MLSRSRSRPTPCYITVHSISDLVPEQISIPKGEQGALVLKIFEIRGRQNERTCVGNCKIDLKFSADSEEGAIGGCSVMWLSCHDEIVGGGKTRSGGENGPEDSSTTVDIMVSVPARPRSI